jgi:hypothetical protein
VNARLVLRWTVDPSTPAESTDESPFVSPLRAVWVRDTAVSRERPGPRRIGAAGLVDVTAPFTWAA